jgi:uncharacterized protein YceH (UPF0502 family)
MENSGLPQLSPEEIRVLGALIEKSLTTPDYYPLTLNSLVTACNQKSARNPVVNYDNDIVLKTADQLKRKLLLANVTGDGRALKYRHTLAVKYPLDPAEVTVLGLLFLRGPLTVGEIKNMAGRMYLFDDLEEVQKTLQQLMDAEIPFVLQLPRRTGQKESRFFHCFTEYEEDDSATTESTLSNGKDLEERILRLEEEMNWLKEKLKDLL